VGDVVERVGVAVAVLVVHPDSTPPLQIHGLLVLRAL
jgi:hypothetical protein